MKGSSSPWRALSLVSIIGVNLVLCSLIGVWLGRKVDMYFSTSPWWMVVGLFVGILAGVTAIIPLIRRFLGEHEDD